MTRDQYIRQNSWAAISETLRSGIPASITLAQGILESGNGNSRLARLANNHFGIKCHSDWYGEHILADDDLPGECFRKYNSVLGSYMDHTRFLQKYPRYDSLFNLGPTNYREWAIGLQKAGYATSPTYAKQLIDIIDQYDLTRYDKRAVVIKVSVISALVLAVIITIVIMVKLKSNGSRTKEPALA
jgi:flagellum-specific peptidoglycan hydrolase FlgJ